VCPITTVSYPDKVTVMNFGFCIRRRIFGKLEVFVQCRTDSNTVSTLW
jgi:hypothetical protein